MWKRLSHLSNCQGRILMKMLKVDNKIEYNKFTETELSPRPKEMLAQTVKLSFVFNVKNMLMVLITLGTFYFSLVQSGLFVNISRTMMVE
jgi:hypothetical protein